MTGLRVITSNRLETLSEALAETVREPLSSPLVQEAIIVQSRGMERWVKLELARHNGICANCAFPFPNAFLQDVFRALVPDMPDTSPFDPGIMAFRVMGLLPSFIDTPEFEPVRTYLSNDGKGLKLYQLSVRIADMFDQYLVFRPEMMVQWEAGKAGHWQARLFRGVCRGHPGLHRASLRDRALSILRGSPPGPGSLPERISIFGISYLPPFHLQFMSEMSRHIPVSFFLMNPCREYWADIVTNRELKRIRERYAASGALPESLHLHQGNRLLASMGVHGRDFLRLVNEFDLFDIVERFSDRPADHPADLLSCIQSDILHLRERQTTPSSDVLDLDPSTIQVHSCHSPMREIEILHDNLLAIFEREPSLQPNDVFVLTPDIEKYAPYIHAVFDAQSDPVLRIPYSVADQSTERESMVIRGFLALLDLKDSRMTADQVLSLLEIPVIRERFELGEPALETICRWVRDTHIRWGIDGDHRRRMGLPGMSENTWRNGIRRLLLGYAAPAGNRRTFDGVLPYDHIEGDDAQTLGRFLDFLEVLFSAYDGLHKQYNTDGWYTFLNVLVDTFICADEKQQREVQVLRRIMNGFREKSSFSRFDEVIGLEVVSSYLRRDLEKDSTGFGFISGGITFCAMLPMRSIPVKVICLVGMDSDAFPRKTASLGFDYITRYPKRGDRSRRSDDKYLFLEALLSARRVFYISYVGQSIRDNSKMPPSSLVAELLDYVSDGLGIPESQMVTHHRLQAFSKRYFTENNDYGRLFSYSAENMLAATGMSEQTKPAPFFTRPLDVPPADWKSLNIEELCQFFSCPAKYLVEKRLGVFLRVRGSILDESESFLLSGLERYGIGRELVQAFRSGMDSDDGRRIQEAAGRLPHGAVGDVAYREMSIESRAFADVIDSHTRSRHLDDRDARLSVDGFTIAGRFSDLHETGQVRIRYGRRRARDLLSAWIYHLCLHSLGEEGLPAETIVLCSDSTWAFDPVDDAQTHLRDLLELYWLGLSEPIPFFPESSYTYCLNLLVRHRDPTHALNAASRQWTGSDFARGESEDPYFGLCFGRTDPIDGRFESIASDVFGPLLGHCNERHA